VADGGSQRIEAKDRGGLRKYQLEVAVCSFYNCSGMSLLLYIFVHIYL